jgi:hypothetical protein
MNLVELTRVDDVATLARAWLNRPQPRHSMDEPPSGDGSYGHFRQNSVKICSSPRQYVSSRHFAERWIVDVPYSVLVVIHDRHGDRR